MKNPISREGEPIPVLIVETSHIHSQILADALRRRSRFQVTTCRAERSECLAILNKSRINVVLMGTRGFQAVEDVFPLLHELFRSHPHLGFVLLSDEVDRDFVVHAFHCGARGLFGGSQSFKELCRCVECVDEGQFWMSAEQLQMVMDAYRNGPQVRVADYSGAALLTPREEQVVRLVAEGMTNREVAAEMKVTENTVKKSICRIFDKVGISNRVELVLHALSSVPERKPPVIAAMKTDHRGSVGARNSA